MIRIASSRLLELWCSTGKKMNEVKIWKVYIGKRKYSNTVKLSLCLVMVRVKI